MISNKQKILKIIQLKNKPIISIITVVFNGVKTLEQTIMSVLTQSYPNIEYIIIDGGSTDGSLEIIEKYEEKISFWISEPDNGLYDAMNKGISKATGDLIGMINSDDWYEPNAIEIIVNTFLQNPSKKIFHGDRFDVLINGEKKIRKYNPSKAKFIYYAMTYNHPSMFIHKSVYESAVYNTKLKALSDYEFVLKQFLANPGFFQYVPFTYVNYRLDGISGQMGFMPMIKEGFVSRMNGGLNIFKNLISVLIRVTIKTIKL